MIKKLFVLFICCFLLISQAFSFSAEVHSDQVLSALYGLTNGWPSNKGAADSSKLKYYNASDSAYVAIDYNAGRIQSLNDNLSNLSIYDNVITEIDYPSLKLGRKSTYNHQGFDFDYVAAGVANSKKKQAIWNSNRADMINSIERAYSLDNVQANMLARELYYAHMLDDLNQGSAKSIKQMLRLSTVEGVIKDFSKSSLRYAIEISDIDPVRSGLIMEYADRASDLARRYASYTDVNAESRMAAKAVLNNEFADLIAEMNETLDMDPFATAPGLRRYGLVREFGGNLLSATLATGAFTIYQAISQGGFGFLTLSDVATIGGITLAGATVDTLISRGIPKVAKAFNFGRLASTSMFVGVSALLDTAFDSIGYVSGYLSGELTGLQSARNIGISVGKNALSYGVSLGVSSALTSIFFPGVAAGVVAGPPGWFTVVLSGVGLGTYFIFNSLAENVINYFDLRDIKTSVNTGSVDYVIWVDNYLGA